MLHLLRAARIGANLRQSEVAEALDKPQSYVSKIENGERRLDPIELKRLADLYGVSILDLLTEPEQEQKVEPSGSS